MVNNRVIPAEYEVTREVTFIVRVRAEKEEDVHWTVRVVEKKLNKDEEIPVVKRVHFDCAAKFEHPASFVFSNLQLWLAQRVFTPSMFAKRFLSSL